MFFSIGFNRGWLLIWGLYNWNLFKVAHKWRYCISLKKLPHAFRQECHWCTSLCITSAKHFVGWCLKQCTTSSCTLSPTWIVSHRGLPWTAQRSADCIVINLGWMQDVWAPCTTWYSVGYGLCALHGNGQYHAAGWWLPWVCLDIWSWLWYSALEDLTVMFCSTSCEVQNQRSLIIAECRNTTVMADACGLNVVGQCGLPYIACPLAVPYI